MHKINKKDIKWIPGSHENPKNPGVYKKVIVKRSEIDPRTKLMMINLCKIPAFKTHIAHSHKTMVEIFYFTAGNGKIKVGGESLDIKPGDRIIVPANTIHQIRNTGKSELKFVGIGVAID